MNLTEGIHYFADSDAIELWWEKPDEAASIAYYELRLNGADYGTTEKTHFTFEGLESGQEYTLQITAKNAEGLLIDDVVLHGRTCAKRPQIIVSDEPYCARGDCVTKNTAAIQCAIDACPEGGTVVIPEGTYLTGALCLHQNMELYISEGAVLLGSVDAADYLPLIPVRQGGEEQEGYKSLINAGEMDHREGPRCHNIIIRGKGTIKGGGEELYAAQARSGKSPGGLISLNNCGQVRINSLTITDGAPYMIHMTYCLDVLTAHCVFRSGQQPQSDGWVPDSSESCTIYDSTFFTGGDAISVKSGKYPEGSRIGRPSRKIRIFDCKSLLGLGLCIGPEISGGIENIRIWDCDLERSTWGIQITATKMSGGYVRGMYVEDCVVPRLRILPTDEGNDADGGEVPDFGNFLYERVKIMGKSLRNGEWRDCRSVEMSGFDRHHPLRNVLLKDIDILEGLGVSTEYCEELHFERDDD